MNNFAQIDGAAILQRRREEAEAFALGGWGSPPAAAQAGREVGAGKVREFLPADEIYTRRKAPGKA